MQYNVNVPFSFYMYYMDIPDLQMEENETI